MKSSKEVVRDTARPAPDSGAAAEALPPPPRAKDVSCIEIIQSRIPIVRSLLRILYGNSFHAGEKLETPVHKPPLPSIAFLAVNDGSCAASLQVLLIYACQLFVSFFFV